MNLYDMNYLSYAFLHSKKLRKIILERCVEKCNPDIEEVKVKNFIYVHGGIEYEVVFVLEDQIEAHYYIWLHKSDERFIFIFVTETDLYFKDSKVEQHSAITMYKSTDDEEMIDYYKNRHSLWVMSSYNNGQSEPHDKVYSLDSYIIVDNVVKNEIKDDFDRMVYVLSTTKPYEDNCPVYNEMMKMYEEYEKKENRHSYS